MDICILIASVSLFTAACAQPTICYDSQDLTRKLCQPNPVNQCSFPPTAMFYECRKSDGTIYTLPSSYK